MFRTIPARRRYAASCSGRIELRRSRRAAGLAYTWLALFTTMTLTAVALPLVVRIALCAGAATACLPAIRVTFLLEGRQAIRGLQWSETGLRAFIGPGLEAVAAEIGPGSFRFGRQLLVLRLQTCDGMRSVLIDGYGQENRAFRRLCRYLESRRRRVP